MKILRVIQRVIKKSLVVGDETIRTIEMTANKCSMSTVNSFKDQVFLKKIAPHIWLLFIIDKHTQCSKWLLITKGGGKSLEERCKSTHTFH